jgi:hypothetical protein
LVRTPRLQPASHWFQSFLGPSYDRIPART